MDDFTPNEEEQKFIDEGTAMLRKAYANAASTREADLKKSNQFCPVCGKKVIEDPNHPNYVCPDDVGRATDRNGRKVNLYQESLSGGFLAQYADDESKAEEVSNTRTVYIDGKQFDVIEERLGGLVVTPKS